jgi:hypothetical protein
MYKGEDTIKGNKHNNVYTFTYNQQNILWQLLALTIKMYTRHTEYTARSVYLQHTQRKWEHSQKQKTDNDETWTLSNMVS